MCYLGNPDKILGNQGEKSQTFFLLEKRGVGEGKKKLAGGNHYRRFPYFRAFRFELSTCWFLPFLNPVHSLSSPSSNNRLILMGPPVPHFPLSSWVATQNHFWKASIKGDWNAVPILIIIMESRISISCFKTSWFVNAVNSATVSAVGEWGRSVLISFLPPISLEKGNSGKVFFSRFHEQDKNCKQKKKIGLGCWNVIFQVDDVGLVDQ